MFRLLAFITIFLFLILMFRTAYIVYGIEESYFSDNKEKIIIKVTIADVMAELSLKIFFLYLFSSLALLYYTIKNELSKFSSKLIIILFILFLLLIYIVISAPSKLRGVHEYPTYTLTVYRVETTATPYFIILDYIFIILSVIGCMGEE